MAHIPKMVDPAENETLAGIEKMTGPANFLRVMAHRPQAMASFFHLYRDLMMAPGLLEPRLKEMMYLAVSTVNECEYCTEHHRKFAAGAGLTDQEIHYIETEQNQHFTPTEQAALHYARELTRTASVEDETRYALQVHLSDDQFVELTMVVAMANFTNRFNEGLAVPLESDVLSRRAG